MDKNIIQTTLPLSATLINKYAIANTKGNNNILFEFDLSKTPLEPNHVMGYLSNIKLDCQLTNYNSDLLFEYMTSSFFIGNSNLIQQHANILTFYHTGQLMYEDQPFDEMEDFISQNEAMIQDQIKFIQSLPLFLITHVTYIKDTALSENVILDRNENIGVNIAKLTYIDDLFLRLCAEDVTSTDKQTYYKYHFDESIYGGDSLIHFFMDSPMNLLHSVIEMMASRYAQ